MSSIHKVASWLTFLPAAAIGLVILSDIASVLWLDSLFREQHTPLVRNLGLWGVVALFVRDFAALGVGWLTLFMLIEAQAYQGRTTERIQQAGAEGRAVIPRSTGT